MPNWCYNVITVEGAPDKVDAVREQLDRPYVVYESTSNKQKPYRKKMVEAPIISFLNVISPAPEDMKEYWMGDTSFNGKTPEEKEAAKDWYSFNNKHWGTKWDVANGYETARHEKNLEDGRKQLVYNCATAWAPPHPVIIELARQNPDVIITLDYEEENRWGGSVSYFGDVWTQESSYDYKCTNCGHEFEETPDLTQEMWDSETCTQCFPEPEDD